MKNFLYKLASILVTHLTRVCVYESKKRGECLCRHCENTNCKVKKLANNWEEIKDGI